jgi:NADH-quinone oxidoreductase subunit C
MDEKLKQLGDHIAASLRGAVVETAVACGQLSVVVSRDTLLRTLTFLRDDAKCLFSCLMDITAVDWPERAERFDVVYNLLSLRLNQRVRIKVRTDEVQPVASAAAIYSAAGWYERETWDMYGILFDGHPDLRRILTDYGFEGHPLRKDFPLTGHVEVRYDEEQKRVVYEPVTLPQEFRRFDFLSPWEGAKYVLPGDEKAQPEAKA